MKDITVYQAASGYVFVQLPNGQFLVVRPDGGTETRYELPRSAVRLVPYGVTLEAA